MELKKPKYNLAAIKAEFSTVEGLNISHTARRSAIALGLEIPDVVALVQTITRTHFVKSMTTYADSKVWQDVYNVPHAVGELYVKFTVDPTGHLMISLKLKGEG